MSEEKSSDYNDGYMQAIEDTAKDICDELFRIIENKIKIHHEAISCTNARIAELENVKYQIKNIKGDA